MLHSLALIAGGALVTGLMGRRSAGWHVCRHVWSRSMFASSAVVAAAAALASMSSIAPHVWWWGQRYPLCSVLTLAADILMFLAVASLHDGAQNAKKLNVYRVFRTS